MKKLMVLISILLVLTACDSDTEKLRQEVQPKENIENVERTENKVKNDEEKKKQEEQAKGEKNDGEQAKDEKDEEIQVVEVSTAELSNKTFAWGFRRMKNGIQPEFTASYAKPLDDYEGIYVGNKDKKVIYLTFDEGYENGYTASILDTLKDKGIEATFFVTKPYVKQNPDLIRRMIDEGHIVGNHTVNHPSMPSVTDDEKLKKEITGLHDYVKENFDYEMTYLRPPKGEFSERTVKISKDLGYTTVLWSFAYDDWDVKKQDRLDYARKVIYSNLHNGCVMLLHAVSKDNTALLGEIIEKIEEEGYEIRPLSEFER